MNLKLEFFLGVMMAKHEHGKMDISDQKKAFSRFISFGLYVSYTVLAVLIFLAIFNS